MRIVQHLSWARAAVVATAGSGARQGPGVLSLIR
jgi:hypothetical protein